MTLPYPHEVETGRLRPLAAQPRTPFDIEGYMHNAIQMDGDGLRIFGVRLEVEDPRMVGAVAQRFRDTLSEHLLERRAQPDAAAWELFAVRARAIAASAERADDALIEALAADIDGM